MLELRRLAGCPQVRVAASDNNFDLTSDSSVRILTKPRKEHSMISEIIKRLAIVFATSVAEAVEEEMKSSFKTKMSALFDSDDAPSPRRGRPESKKKHLAPKKASAKNGARLARRTPAEILAVVGKVTTLLRNKGEMRSEQIRKALDLDVREVPRVLKEGIATGAFRITGGEKRSTTYGMKGGKSAKSAKKTSGKKAAKKASAKKASAKTSKARASAKKKKKVTRKAKVSKTANGAAGHATAAAAAT